MLLKHTLGLLISPQQEWRTIAQAPKTVASVYLELVLILALIPPFAGFYGTTQIGWQIGWQEPVKLTTASALPIAVAFYCAILLTIFLVGKAIHWMATTYGAKPSFADCVALSAFTAVPLLLLGFIQFYPVLWLNFLVGLIALAYTVYLLFTGVPIVMAISAERGFLLSSAVVTFGLVAFVALLTATVLLWSIGFHPEFTTG